MLVDKSTLRKKGYISSYKHSRRVGLPTVKSIFRITGNLNRANYMLDLVQKCHSVGKKLFKEGK